MLILTHSNSHSTNNSFRGGELGLKELEVFNILIKWAIVGNK